MKIREVSHLRLKNQLLSHQPLQSPGEVVKWMLAMQAQDYLAALWAIGIRIAPAVRVNESLIEQAITRRTIVRSWPMRGTLHFVAAEDVRWMLRLLTPRVIKSHAGRYRQLGLDEAVFSKSMTILEAVLQGERLLTRAELFSVMEKAGISTGAQRGIHILSYLAMSGRICFGPKKGKEYTFTLLDDWIPKGRELDREEALETLAMRYISSRGPVTAYDFAGWSGLTLTQAREGMEMLRSDFEQVEIAGQTYWFPDPGTASSNFTAGVYFLPAFDEMLCGYKDRSALLPAEHVKATILKNGIFKPVIVINGEIIGSWKRSLKMDRVLIDLDPFKPMNKKQEDAIYKAAERYGSFQALPTCIIK